MVSSAAASGGMPTSGTAARRFTFMPLSHGPSRCRLLGQPDATKLRRRHPANISTPGNVVGLPKSPYPQASSSSLPRHSPSTPHPILGRCGLRSGHYVLSENCREALGMSVVSLDAREGALHPPAIQSDPLSEVWYHRLDNRSCRPGHERIRCPACGRMEMTRAAVPTTRQFEEKAGYSSECRQLPAKGPA